MRPSSTKPRRASVYVLVLATAAIATAAGLGGILVQRTRLRAASTNADIDAARLAAASGLEYALARIDADPNWRTTLGAGSWLDAAPLGNATLRVNCIDPASLAKAAPPGQSHGLSAQGMQLAQSGSTPLDDSDPTSPIILQSIGEAGDACQVFEACIEFDRFPMGVLNCAAYAGVFAYTELTTLTANAPVHSAGSMNALVANVNADAEAVGSITGLTYARASNSSATPRTAPGTDLVATWAALGTTIPSGVYPANTIQRGVLARGVAFGSYTNTTSDVFVINAAGATITIQNVRVYGTLVILNAASVVVASSVRFDPVTPGYPSLIVQGPIRMQVSTTALSESTNNTNYNPTGAPYAGVTDNDKADTYASGFSGIVFATDDITIENNLTMTGTLVTLDTLTVRKPLTITHDPNVLTAAAPGFYTIIPRLADAGVERVSR
ncbi:MAG: hypothetical protein R3B68_10975 [Phycisphaerales bacterium]